MKYLSLFLLATVMMFSCGDAETTAIAEEPTVATPSAVTAPEVFGGVPDKELSSMLVATLNAVMSVGTDLTALPAGAAVSNIEGWITELGTVEGTDGMIAGLTSLKTELTAGKIDGGKVSTLLSSLADQTKAMIPKESGLVFLASALQAGADKLGGK